MKDHLIRYYNTFVGLLWLLLFFTLWGQFIFNSDESPGISFVVSLVFIGICFAFVTFTSRFLLPKAIGKLKIKRFIVQALILAMLLALINAFFLAKFSPTEYPNAKTDFSYYLFSLVPTSFMLMIGFCGLEVFRIYMVQQRIHLEEKLRFLQNQMNPHIMFNVLNHIHILMNRDVELASDLLLQFSGILRYQLYECNQEQVSLGKEIQYLKDIAEVEHIRWGNELEVCFTELIEDPTKTIRPLLLITFIENAFKHVDRLPMQQSFVHIKIEQKANLLTLEVKNSTTDYPVRKSESSGLGLDNTIKRLEMMYPDKHQLKINKDALWYSVTLTIDLN